MIHIVKKNSSRDCCYPRTEFHIVYHRSWLFYILVTLVQNVDDQNHGPKLMGEIGRKKKRI